MHRPIAPGLIQGAVRGLLAGAFTATVLALVLLALLPDESATKVVLVLAVPIVATVLGAADGLEARIGPRRLVRFAAPVLGGGLAGTVLASADALVMGRTGVGVPTEVVLAAAVAWAGAGVPLGIALMIAGPHERGASVGRRYIRALEGGAIVGSIPLLIGGAELVLRVSSEGVALVVAGFGGAALAAVHCTGHLVFRSAGRSVGQWLEPGNSWTARVEAREKYGALASEAAELRRLAERTAGEEERRALLERGLERSREAFDVAERAHLELVREEAGRQLRYFLRALGRTEEAGTLKV